MTANKIPESPIGLFGWLTSSQQAVLKLHEKDCYMAGYIAALEAARQAVPSYTRCEMTDHYNTGRNRGLSDTLTNLTALEQEAKK